MIKLVVAYETPAMGRALGSPEGQAATNDLMNFATGGAELMFVDA